MRGPVRRDRQRGQSRPEDEGVPRRVQARAHHVPALSEVSEDPGDRRRVHGHKSEGSSFSLPVPLT